MAEAVLSWSGGKDAAFCLDAVRSGDEMGRGSDPGAGTGDVDGDGGDAGSNEGGIEVVELLTSVNTDVDRVSMHGVRRALLAAQADTLGLPVRFVELPADCSNATYRARMADALAACRGRGVTDVAFADLFLSDVRAYRESNLAGTAFTGHWPLWERDTGALAREFLDRGFRAVVVCVDDDALDADAAGREYDGAFLDDLPAGVDPCGERGEFHTFVYDGPSFEAPVPVERGERVTHRREGTTVHYRDLRPAGSLA